MKTVQLGNKQKKYRSIKEAAEAAGIPYITLYMRLRMGNTAKIAMKKPVRKYVKREMAAMP